MTYELSTTAGVSWSGIVPNAYSSAWIDWNRNNVFEDAELVAQNNGVNPFVSAVRVPTTAVSGATRMRIAVKSGSFPTQCATFESGEVEDYTVIVVESNPANVFDLTVTNLAAPSRLAYNQTDSLRFDIKNIGGTISSSGYVSTSLVSNNPSSNENVVLNVFSFDSLAPNARQSFVVVLNVPTTWTTELANFYVSVLANAPEINKINNSAQSPVNVAVLPLSCGHQISNENTVLCFDNSNPNAIKINVAEGAAILQKIVDRNGQVLSSSTVGNLVQDSVYVVNNQVVKKLANGTIAFTKGITPSVLNRFPKIEKAVEMTDGTFVLAGLHRYFAPQGNLSLDRDSIVLVTTDAQLNFQQSFNAYVNGGAYTPPYDSLLQLIKLPNNQFVVMFYKGLSESVSQGLLNFTKYQKNNDQLSRIKNYQNGSYLDGKPIQSTICGNNLFVKNSVPIGGSSKGGTYGGTYSTILNLDSLSPLALKRVSTGYSLIGYGADYSYIYSPNLQEGKYDILGTYGYNSAIGRTNYADLDINFYDTFGQISFKKTIPFVINDHIIRTGDTTCLIVLKRNGQTFAYNPDCNNPPNILPDLTIANLSPRDPSVSQGQILNFSFDAKNIGLGNATNAFTIKSYLSANRFLDAYDYQNGVISTANYAAGTTINQIQGAMTVGNSLAVGEYYLILKIDADEQIAENNEFNNVAVASIPINVVERNSGANDPALSLLSTPSVYRQYSTQNVQILLQNLGNRVFSNMKIDFPFPAKTVSGGVVVPSIGTWQEWCSGGTQCFTWTIPTLAANTTATLDVPLYVLDAVAPIIITTHLLSATPATGIYATSTSIRPAGSPPMPQPLIPSKPTASTPIFLQRLNPTIAEHFIVVELESSVNQSIDFQIVNALGIVVLTQKLNIEQGNNKLNFNVEQLPKGMYFIQTSLGNADNVPMKFVKM
jgi:GEVED domain/CARDB/Secretion system C-terminal sorting domain